MRAGMILESPVCCFLLIYNGNNFQEHICRTSGLLRFFFQYVEVCRDEDVFASILERIEMIGASTMEFSLHLQQQFVLEKLQSVCGTTVSGGLLISGFLQAVTNRFRRCLPTFQKF